MQLLLAAFGSVQAVWSAHKKEIQAVIGDSLTESLLILERNFSQKSMQLSWLKMTLILYPAGTFKITG